MSLIYVTGAPGAGKTTLQNELKRRGYDARDLDNPAFGGPHNKQSGERVTIPPADQRTPAWFEAHEWRIYHKAFDELKTAAKDNDIIICGVAASDGEILHVFDKIIYLKLDDRSLTERLKSRADNDYGKNDFELQEILNRKHGLDTKYASADVTVINAEKTLTEVVDDILSHI
jgi:broad-specificity NMP kinase